MSIRPIIFNNTVLRDGHQSLAATRMTTAQMLPAVPALDELGFGALETWGGATIDACLRFLGEDPFGRLDQLKALSPKTPHTMLLRGQNIVQYAHFPDDVVEAFIERAHAHGIGIFRIFDALNDPRNMECAMAAARNVGARVHGTICYTRSPVHTPADFIDLGVRLAAMGSDAIVIKDMAGLIPPYIAKAIVAGLKARIEIPVWVHTHDTAGLGAATYLAAVDAGADAVDVSVVPFANGTGQPDTVRMLALLENHPRIPDFPRAKLEVLARLREHFEKVYAELAQFTAHQNEVVDSDALKYQVPGGMLSNFRTQLREQKMQDRFDEVFAEIPYVRRCLGWIPLVTPTSQIVGVQAMLNVKFGRWKNFSPQAADLALGYYGTPPGPIDPDVRALAAKQMGKAPIACRPADLQRPGMAKLRADLPAQGLPATDEAAVLYAMFPEQTKAVLGPHPTARPTARREGGAPARPGPLAGSGPVPAPAPVPGRPRQYVLTVEGRRHEVTVEELP